MAEFEEGMLDVLEANAGLLALISTRIYPRELPQEPTLPALTYSLVTAPTDYTHDSGVKKVRAQYQFDCWGTSYGETVRLATALKLAIPSLRAVLSSGHRCDRAFIVNSGDTYDPESKRDRRMVEVELSYEES